MPKVKIVSVSWIRVHLPMMIVTTQLPYLRLWKKLKPAENLSIFQKDVSILINKLISKLII